MTRLQLQAIGKRVGVETHIYPVDLELRSGTLNVLLGPTGAGKTTLLRLIAGLDTPTEGRLLLTRGGETVDVTGVDVRKRNVAFVYQRFVNYPTLTVFENIASPLRVARASDTEVRRRVAEIADLLSLSDLLERRPAQLSGGQQQRCAIARALIKDASVVLLDEPLANLDFKLREQLRESLGDLLREREAVVVYATAEPEEALILGGHVAVVDAGRVLQTGEVSRVYREPATTRVAEVFSDPPMNVVAAARLPHAPAGAHWIGLRAHDLKLEAAGDLASLQVVVELAELSGSTTRLHARLGDTPLIAQAPGIHPLAIGSACTLYFDPSELLAFDEDGARL